VVLGFSSSTGSSVKLFSVWASPKEQILSLSADAKRRTDGNLRFGLHMPVSEGRSDL